MKRRWSLTGVFVVRHAGMPFDWLSGLGGSTSLLAAADTVLNAEEALRAHPRAARPAVQSVLASGRPEQLGGGDERWRSLVKAWAEALGSYEEAFSGADEAATGDLRAVMEHEEVREAVLLSNPDAYHNMLLPFLARGGGLTSRRRRERRQLYTYLQRFCAKNETTSFFGPMAYGSPVPGGALTLVDRPPNDRRVFLSAWAVRAVRRAVIRDRGMLPSLLFCLTGRTAGPGEGERALARELEGRPRRIGELARAVGLPAKDVAAALRDMIGQGCVDVLLGGDPYDPQPLATLRDQVARTPDTPARLAWLERLDRLEALRCELEAADLDGRVRLIPALEGLFTEITGEPARRAAGRTYADRAVFFEECASRFSLQVGQELLDAWSRQITPLLEACVAHGAATQASAADAVLDRWEGPDEQPLSRYAAAMAAAFETTGSVFQAGHAPRYPAAVSEGELARLSALAGEQEGDRYAVIDLCLAAGTAEEVPRSRPLVARVHHHLQVDGWLATMHPRRADFDADARGWLARQDGGVVGFDFGRRNKGFYLFPGTRVALRDPVAADGGDERVLAPEELSVRRSGRSVELWHGDRPVRAYLPLSDFVKYPPYAVLSHPQVVHPLFTGAPGESVPAVGVDTADLQRARWDSETGTLTDRRPWIRFLALRRLARRTGRRFLFCRTGGERKPYLLDTATPLAADLAAHIAARSDSLTLEEMSPGPEELWLRDSEGRRYTCEFRMQAIGRAG